LISICERRRDARQFGDRLDGAEAGAAANNARGQGAGASAEADNKPPAATRLKRPAQRPA
jgi:hypothetical protein